jgi:RNA polymerase sigma-70 factor, ECF subfamily
LREDLSNQTDTEVYQALQSGNQQALGVIYDRYGVSVYRLALRMLGNTTEAEDLTQEVFLTFWKGTSYDSSRGSMVVFLMTITRSSACKPCKYKHNYRF